jgi:hypothetical protein
MGAGYLAIFSFKKMAPSVNPMPSTMARPTGVNTVEQSLRNSNGQLRSEPANPQLKVSPWLESTIEPDTERKPLEIE